MFTNTNHNATRCKNTQNDIAQGNACKTMHEKCKNTQNDAKMYQHANLGKNVPNIQNHATWSNAS